MALILSGISLSLDASQQEAVSAALKKLGLKSAQVRHAAVSKKSVDARHKKNIKFVYSVQIELFEGEEKLLTKNIPGLAKKQTEELQIRFGEKKLSSRPVICGFGPAGMFSALVLAQNGYNPLIIERGEPIEQRVHSVQQFWTQGILNTKSNVQFGEGGAGTFSDGKLTTRIGDPRCQFILKEFVRFGAPEEILTQAKPHIGTDKLRKIIRAVREEICRLGGEFHFNKTLTDLRLETGKLKGFTAQEADFEAEVLVLAVGHSARDTFSMLLEKGVAMQSKAFSVGVRIEHPQMLINESLYGDFASHPKLGAAEYQFSHRKNEKAVYTFCMCPGGVVVPASSEDGTIVTNGMSYHRRDGENSNSALVVSVDQKDFGTGVLDGAAFQSALERSAFALTRGNFRAPGQNAASFLADTAPKEALRLAPSYALGTELFPLKQLFSPAISEMLKEGLRRFDRKIPGFAGENAFLTGPETRTSSPVRILRAENLQSVTVQGLFPCGEGAGYAGGIMSAAVDGLRVAQKIIETYRPFS